MINAGYTTFWNVKEIDIVGFLLHFRLEDKNIETITKKERQIMSSKLKLELQSKDDLLLEHQFHMQLPKDHNNHLEGEIATTVMPIDRRLAKYIHEKTIEESVSSSREMRILLIEFVRSLFEGKKLPSRYNSRDSSLDQNNLQSKVEHWVQEFPDDKFKIRLKSADDTVNCENDIINLDVPVEDDVELGEINAVEETFVDIGTLVYLCDFHRVQAWNRWLKASCHKISQSQKDPLMQLMKAIADSDSKDQLDENINELKDNPEWKTNDYLEQWFETKYLKVKERWVKLFREEHFNAKTETVSQLVHIIVNKYLPESLQRYLKENTKCSSQIKAYNTDIPSFLCDRPSNFVQHVMLRWIEASKMTEIIDQVDPCGIFFVGSASNKEMMYEVKFDCGNGTPKCQCPDWKRYHLPCKHMLFVIQSEDNEWTWNHFPEDYRNSPFYTLDLLRLSQPLNSNEEADDVLCVELNVNDQGSDADDEKPQNIKSSFQMSMKCRAVLKEIDSLTYLCTDIGTLQDTFSNLEKLKSKISSACPNEGPFLAEKKTSQPITVKTIKQKAAKIPLRRSSRTVTKKTEVLSSLDPSYNGVKNNCETKVGTGASFPKTCRVTWADGFATDFTHVDIDNQKAKNKVDHIWNADLASNYFLAKVYKTDITYGDISSLKVHEWLTDKIVDAYLGYIAQMEMDKGRVKVRHEVVSTVTNILNGRYVTGRNEKNKIKPYDFIIGAYHQKSGHWDLLPRDTCSRKCLFKSPTDTTTRKELPGFITPLSPPKKKCWQPVWTQKELCSLVEFVTLHKDFQSSENEWPAMNADNVYWTKASDFIKQTCGSVRSSKCSTYIISMHYN
ncbi:unnamed protein product [Mytilus coruscus]|uniref:SWIM-type domain-containing protein n=1 Tax=Mytilus coruscus TaxID=42192 RepID=A0A6J8EPN0_MYTCO|nr:unnamed protein product [Mytilus coruscus]